MQQNLHTVNDKKDKKRGKRLNKKNILGVILVIFMIFMAKSLLANYMPNDKYAKLNAEECTYQEFENMKGVDRVFIDFEEKLAENKFFFTQKDNEAVYETDYPATENFKKELLDKNIAIYPKDDVFKELNVFSFDPNISASDMSTVLYLIMMLFFFSMLTSSIGNVNANKYNEETKRKQPKKTMEDVAGLHEVKKDVNSIIDFLQNGDKYKKAGAMLPNGIIFYGPPGTGKTLLAKAIAGEANVPFFYMNGSDFVELYVGLGAKRVRSLFEEARKCAPAIVFIDEIDAIGGNRSNVSGNSEDRKTLNALLTEMDGFKGNGNVIVIGATNRIEDIDPALLRAGRFTEKFYIPQPETSKERMEVIRLYTKNKKIAEDVDLNQFAKDTLGCSPADIEAILNEAVIIAVRNQKEYITKEFLEEAYYKRIVGGHPKESVEREKNEIRICAVHEAGHSLVGLLCGQKVSKVTIIPSTNGAGGITFFEPDKLGLYSAEELKTQIKVLYAGRIAEYIELDDWNKVTTGASSDLDKATKIVKEYVMKYGMNREFGLLTFEKEDESIKEAMINLSRELYDETYSILKSKKDILFKIRDELIKKETMTGEEVKKLISPVSCE